MGATERVVHDHHHHHYRHPGLSFHYRRQERNDDYDHDEVKKSEIRKGCVTVIVGQMEEEEQERVLVPISYMNHPLFVELLKEAEEEYGFDQKGPISIPCRVDEFKFIQEQIDKDSRSLLHHHHYVWPCFGV